MVEYDIVAVRLEGFRPLRRRRVVNLVHAVGRYLGDEHLRNQGKALVEGSVDAGDDQKEQE